MEETPTWLKEMDREYFKLVPGLVEIGRQFHQKGLYPYLGHQEFVREFRQGGLTPDMTKAGWVLVAGNELPSQTTFSTSRLAFVPILRRGEPSISGEEIRKRALKENANFGQRFGGFLLTHRKKIRVRPGRRYRCLLLPQDVWCDRDGYLCVPCLKRNDKWWHPDFFWWNAKRWSMDFFWLGDAVDQSVGFLQLRD